MWYRAHLGLYILYTCSLVYTRATRATEAHTAREREKVHSALAQANTQHTSALRSHCAVSQQTGFFPDKMFRVLMFAEKSRFCLFLHIR